MQILASDEWIRLRPLWFRLPRFGRIAWILFALITAFSRHRWLFDPKRIRAILIVRDIHTTVPQLVESLLSQGIIPRHIFLVDSGSTSSVCLHTLKSLQKLGCRLICLPPEEQCFGPYAPWLVGKLQREIRSWRYPYIVSDPDLSVPTTIPADWLAKLFITLNQHRWISKVALPLSLEQLTSLDRDMVIMHERQLSNQIFFRLLTRLVSRNSEGLTVCPTDTTLALYRPMCWFSTFAMRLGQDYEILHMPWYIDFTTSSEYAYYQSRKLRPFGQWSSVRI